MYVLFFFGHIVYHMESHHGYNKIFSYTHKNITLFIFLQHNLIIKIFHYIGVLLGCRVTGNMFSIKKSDSSYFIFHLFINWCHKNMKYMWLCGIDFKQSKRSNSHNMVQYYI